MSHQRAQCAERRTLGSAGGCAEKARIQTKTDTGPRRAAHPTDAATVRGIAAAITRAIAPGSYVVISAGSGDEQTGGRLAREYQAGTLYNHSPAQIGAFFDGLDLIPPGLTNAMAWVPGPAAPLRSRLRGGHILAGVGRKPATG